MDRLTDKRLATCGYYVPKNKDERRELQASCPSYRELYVRLADYEDTGLTPEEIKNSLTDATDLAKVAMALRKLRKYEDTGLTPERIERLKDNILWADAFAPRVTDERYKEICAAEKTGRLIVLPCNVGDMVWRVNFDKRRKRIEEIRFDVNSYNAFGKTIFRTREEAEAALAAEERNGE